MVYHGTTPERARAVVDEGILPRERVGHSNWGGQDMQSIADHVYLTEPFAPFYGKAAGDGSGIGLVEIDLDALNDRCLYPDEDFIEQAIRHEKVDVEYPDEVIDLDGDMAGRTAEIREHVELFQPYWRLSLDVLGNVSYKGAIPSEAITRVVVADPPSDISLQIDPVIQIEAVQVTKPKYNVFTRLLMGDDVGEQEYVISTMGVPVPEGAELEELVDDDDIEQMLNARDISVDEVLEQEYVETVYDGGCVV